MVPAALNNNAPDKDSVSMQRMRILLACVSGSRADIIRSLLLGHLPPYLLGKVSHLLDQHILRLGIEEPRSPGIKPPRFVAPLPKHARRGEVAKDVITICRHP